LFLKLFAGEYPISFEVHKFLNPATTHIYPIYNNLHRDEMIGSGYLFVCAEERGFLDSCVSDVHAMLGFRAVTHDPLCWIKMTLTSPLMWEGACIVRSEDVMDERAQMLAVTRYVEVARRRGFSATITSDTYDDEEDLIHREIRYGPVLFRYNNSADMQPIDAANHLLAMAADADTNTNL